MKLARGLGWVSRAGVAASARREGREEGRERERASERAVYEEGAGGQRKREVERERESERKEWKRERSGGKGKSSEGERAATDCGTVEKGGREGERKGDRAR